MASKLLTNEEDAANIRECYERARLMVPMVLSAITAAQYAIRHMIPMKFKPSDWRESDDNATP